MYQFQTIDFFAFRNGTVYNISPNQLPEGMFDPDDLVGQEVEVNGEVLTITGIESFAFARSEEMPYNREFGIYVE